MTTQEECILSFYQTISTIGNHSNIYLVKHMENGEFYVKKELETYNTTIYERIKQCPISNMPVIYECIEDNGKLIVIEEYIHGKSMKKLYEEKGNMPEDQLAYCIRNICNILQQLHSLNPPIIHRDIKPSNILVTNDGTVKLIDINIAKPYTEGEKQDTVLMGTKEFAAPEQYGFGQSDARTDIYALGVTMNYLCCGEFPKNQLYQGKLTTIIEKCTQIDRKNRYQNMKELEHDLEWIETQFMPRITEKVGALKDGKSVNDFKLPGFRTNTFWKKIVAICGYILILYVGLTMQIDRDGLALW